MSVAATGQELAERLRAALGGAVLSADDGAVYAAPESIAEVCAHLRDDPELDFAMLNSLTAVDYVECFEVVYRLTSLRRNATCVVKTRVYGRDEPTVPTVSGVWRGAVLQEREVYDLMGVRFEGHPDLRRILTWEGFEGHPLRRDYLEPPLPYTWPHGG